MNLNNTVKYINKTISNKMSFTMMEVGLNIPTMNAGNTKKFWGKKSK
jgi:hypothetical protein